MCIRDRVIIEATSAEWGDAINAMNAIAALVGSKQVTINKSEKITSKVYEREWEWMNREDGSRIIQKRQKRHESDDE